ncbi:hypothetical protein H8E07_10315 [bacterium]|nr:hypothetical protein [bacterium]
MPRRPTSFTYRSADPTRLPDEFVESATLLIDLHRRGLVHDIAQRLRIRRQGGFPALDVVLLLFVYFASGCQRGLRKSWDRLGPHAAALAALAGRKGLPSPAATSRALAAVETDLTRAGADWLLGEGCGIDAVLRHPAAATWDAQGQPWHVFDVDPTVTTLRQRALPRDEDLPEARRRSQDSGTPGYSGRKRGDIVLKRVTVQHAGAGAWLHAHLSPGNGEAHTDLQLCLEPIGKTCDRLGVQRGRTLVRMDGEFGNVPVLTACREHGLPLLTRLNRASAYKDPELMAILRGATWDPVPDSRSGPRRFAADLGEVTLPAGSRTRRPDGSRYEPVRVRLVASAYRDAGRPNRGRALGGWRLELFLADLPSSSWPAPDCVATYFARSSEENRFAQEDRELGLDRIVSYHLPGQELASVIGLATWNLRVVRGFQAEPPPVRAPVLPLRQQSPTTDGPPPRWPPDPVLANLLSSLDWDELLARRPGWRWSAEACALLCEDERPLQLSSFRAGAPDAECLGAIFRRPTGGCEDCGPSSDCLHTVRPRASKHVELQVPADVACAIAQRLGQIRQVPPSIAKVVPAPGPLVVTQPLLLPAEARKVHRERFCGATLHVELEQPAPQPPWPRLVAADERVRQRRRKTWQQRLDDYALPEGARLSVRVQGSTALRRFLGEGVVAGKRSGAVARKPS